MSYSIKKYLTFLNSSARYANNGRGVFYKLEKQNKNNVNFFNSCYYMNILRFYSFLKKVSLKLNPEMKMKDKRK